MRRNIVLAILVVIVVGVWRVHVHHARLAVPATHSALPTMTVARPRSAELHGASIAGTVRDDAGAAIAGARVCASTSSPALPTDLTRAPRCARTAVNGAYVISNLYAADYQVSAMANQFTLETFAPNGPDQPVVFPLAANEERRGVDLMLHRGGGEVTGTISDVGGGVIPRAQVRVDATWQRYGTASIAVETDEHGRYSAWLRAGSISLVADADGYASATRQASAPAEIDLVLVPESTLAGTVVDAVTGAPVADVTVGASAVDNGLGSDTTLTDGQGRFVLSRLAPGRFTAFARAAHGTGVSDGSTQLGLGQRVDGVVVRLYPAHQIVARVTADGKPCTTASLSLVDERQNLHPDIIRDPDGTLHADGVLPGTYLPAPSCDGYVGRDHYDPIVVTDRDVTATWTVDSGATITGRVRTASGKPLANAGIDMWTVATAERGPSTYATDRTSREGDYAMRGLRPGHYKIQVWRPDTAGTLGGATTATEIDIEISALAALHRDIVVPDAAGAIVGHVTTAEGSRCHFFIQARPVTGSPTIVASDDAGRFEFHGLVPQSYELVVLGGTDHGLMDNLTPVPTKVEVGVGPPATVNLVVERPSGVIRGRVVDDHGAPVTDAFVGLAFEYDPAPVISNARNDNDEILVGSDGRFVAAHLSKGPYTVRAVRKGGGEVIAAHVAVGSELTLVLAPTAEIAGTARRAGAAIDDLHVTVFDRDTDDRRRDETFFRTGGKFALHDLPAGHYRIVLATGGSERATTLDLADGQHATLDVDLPGMVTLVGHAIDAHGGGPVAGIEMYANLASVSLPFLTPSDYRNTSDATGRFELPNTPRGTLEISGRSLADRGRSFDPATLHRTVTPDDPDVIDIGNILVVTTTSATRGDPGLAIEATGDPHAARVVSVDPKGVAAAAGIVTGDVITAVDGVDVTGAAADAARTLVAGDPGLAIALTLERSVTVTIVLVPMAP